MNHNQEEIGEFIENVLANKNFKENLNKYLNKVAMFDEKIISIGMTAAQIIFREKKGVFINEYLNAIILVKESMEVNSEMMIKYVKNYIYKYFIGIA
jgi:hypothetical protein